MIRLTVIAGAAALLAGCASLSPDAGMNKVSALVHERTGQSASWQRSQADIDAAQARIAELLKAPLTPDAAVEVALLGNRGLQADLAELGISEAYFVQAGRPKGPTLSFGRVAGGGAIEVDRSLMFSVLDLLTLPSQAGVARQRFEQAQFKAAADVVAVASRARRAWFEAVAANQLEAYTRQVMQAAEAANDLAVRMVQAGNLSKLDQMRDQAFYADAAAEVARAQQDATAAHERLVRLLGMWGDQANFKLPEQMPDLPAKVDEPQNIEQIAMDKRLDVLMAKRSAEATASSLGLTRVTGFVNALDAGFQNKDQTGTPNERGFQVQVELPLFDFGGARVARAQAQYQQAIDHTAAVAIDARSEVREAYAAYRTTYDLARHYRDEVVPLRKRISDESLLRYNGMLVDVFQLLADSREQIASVMSTVRAQRDFWIAQGDLQTAMTAGSPADGATR